MKINYKWKKQLTICIPIFLVLLLAGYFLKLGYLIFIGIIMIGISALIAERALRCPECRESLFKQAMERGAKEIECPKCGAHITME